MSERRAGTSFAVVALVLVAGLLIGGLVTSYVLMRRINDLQSDLANLSNQLSHLSGNQTLYNQTITIYQNETALADMYQKTKDSVVLIRGNTASGTVQGSGFIYNMTGSMVVVTNNHVVDGTTSLSVTFADGNGYSAVVNGTDPYADLAVLTVLGAAQTEFKPLIVVNSSTLQVGDPVIAIGAPYGLVGSMTTGVVSALGRTITEEEYTGGFAIANIIQTSAPINPGNSGGPLLNFDGKVVGITAAIIENAQGLGFAVPSNTILREIAALLATGSYDGHSYLGVRGIDMDYFRAQNLGVNVTYGWAISEIVTGGPADNAGVEVNDVLVGINGFKIHGSDEMSSYLEEKTLPGQTITLNLVRDNNPLDLLLILGQRPPPP
ncbi:MAG TPA: trypsin-like peptidase domain-containing protein [Candidatus Bathyarchaeia archaeon]|nr:trypsin-like peptidase domain-containing protein [Candidatus Bathyarchaeia archaeon]